MSVRRRNGTYPCDLISTYHDVLFFVVQRDDRIANLVEEFRRHEAVVTLIRASPRHRINIASRPNELVQLV